MINGSDTSSKPSARARLVSTASAVTPAVPELGKANDGPVNAPEETGPDRIDFLAAALFLGFAALGGMASAWLLR